MAPLHDAKELQAPHLCPTELPVPGQDVELSDPEQVNTETVSGSPEQAPHLSPTFGPVSGYDVETCDPVHTAVELQAPHLCPAKLPVPGQVLPESDPEQVNCSVIVAFSVQVVHLSPPIDPKSGQVEVVTMLPVHG